MAKREPATNRHRGSSPGDLLAAEGILMDFDDHQPLRALARNRPTRAAREVEDLDEDPIAAREAAEFGHLDPDLDEVRSRSRARSRE